jgi:hypothetical protein
MVEGEAALGMGDEAVPEVAPVLAGRLWLLRPPLSDMIEVVVGTSRAFKAPDGPAELGEVVRFGLPT